MTLQIAIGQYALDPKQLETAGILKPGSAAVAASLIEGGASPAQALAPNLFAGKPGAENLKALISNPAAQTDALVTNLQQAQTKLTSSGIITGSESPEAIGGAVLSAATQGLDNTLSTIKNATGQFESAGGQINGTIDSLKNATGSVNGVLGSIAGGNKAASIAQNIAGGLGGINEAAQAKLASLGAAQIEAATQGSAAAAFQAISASMPELPVGKPINLLQVAKESATKTALASLGLPSTPAASPTGDIKGALTGFAKGQIQGALDNQLGKVLGSGPIGSAITSGINGAINSTIDSAINSATSSISSMSSKDSLINAATSKLTGAFDLNASSIASGLNTLPGGQASVSNLVDSAKDKLLGKLPGGNLLKSAIDGAASSALNGLASQLDARINEGLKALAGAGLPPGATAQLESALSSLASGGESPITMPTIAVNTTLRESVTAQIASTLGDPAIPVPNLSGEVAQEAKSALETFKGAIDTRIDATKKLAELKKQEKILEAEYEKAQRNLPAGDPLIDAARQMYLDALNNPEKETLINTIAGRNT